MQVSPNESPLPVPVSSPLAVASRADDLDSNHCPEFELRIVRSVRKLVRAIDVHSRHLSVQFQVTGPQLICLAAIVETGKITATEIARNVHLSPSTVVGILDRLEEKALITRERNPDDRRLVYIRPTERGTKTLEYTPSPLQACFSGALQQLPPQEQETLVLSLEQLVDLLGTNSSDHPHSVHV